MRVMDVDGSTCMYLSLSGIIEFMSPQQISQFGGMELMKKHSVPIPCMPLSTIFSKIKVQHINFFVLDTEGSEFSILQTIDWARVSFDVIVIETAANVRYSNYSQDIAAYLKPLHYEQVHPISGRNSWFKRIDFTPSRRPSIMQHCYSGALWATRWRNQNHTQQEYFKFCPAGYFYGDKCQNCPMLSGTRG
jgi:hypothetical protein